MSKRRYKRGDRLNSLSEVMEEKLVYLGPWQSPRTIEVAKSLTYRTLEGYLNGYGIYKAVECEKAPKERIEIKLDGQINLFEVEDGENGN